MHTKIPSIAAVLGTALLLSACGKDHVTVVEYGVPSSYDFHNADYEKSTKLVKMTVELDSYLKKANAGSTVVPLDPTVVDNMFANTFNPFSDAGLNNAGVSMASVTADAALYKSYADSVLIFNTGVLGAPGVGGFVPRNSNKIVVGPTGLEYGQAYVKGSMGALMFKEVVRLLGEVKTLDANDSETARTAWDAAFGFLSVPENYDTAITYANTDPNRPLLWGGYLAERGKPIQAGSTIFNAFLKGRAAIDNYDAPTRNEQADIILAKWEQLAAIAALNYVTTPTSSGSIGNYGSQLHALSEGFGFVAALKYRPASSKLSVNDFNALNNILHTDFYVLLNQPGFTDLVKAQNILKTTYGL